jgi:hypothetical protein
MATDDPVSRSGNGSKIGLASRRSQPSNSAAYNVRVSGTGRRSAEFSKLRHYVRQMHGVLLDTEA